MLKRSRQELKKFRPRESSFRVKKLKRPKTSAPNFLGFFFVLLLLILIVSLAGLFYFNRDKSGTSEQGAKFWFYGNPEQIVGQEETFSIFIKNKEAHHLGAVEVVLNFPEEFVLNSSLPECDQILAHGCVWRFAKITRNQLKQIELNGRLFGEPEEPQIFDGYLNFRLAGFSSEFQEKLSSEIILKPSISLNWEMPDKSRFGESIDSVLSLENISDKEIPSAELVIDLSDNFVFESSDQEIIRSQNKIKWSVENLGPGEQKILKFKGYVNNPEIEELTLNLETGVVYENRFFVQIEEEKKISLEKFDFSLSLEADSRWQSELSGDWGQILPISLIYQNNSQRTIEDFVLKLKLIDVRYINTTQLKQNKWQHFNSAESLPTVQSKVWYTQNKNFDSQEYTIFWDKNLISNFERILPGTSGRIAFDLPIKSLFAAVKASYSQIEILIQPLASGKLVKQGQPWKIVGTSTHLKIRTNVVLGTAARYYNDEYVRIGQGSLPPQVDQETYYWIFFRIKNTTNPIENILIKTELPEGVEWTGQTKASHGLVLYNKVRREVGWQIPELAAYRGGHYSLVEAGFEVSITPESSQVDSVLALTESIALTARDKFTSDLISKENSFLDTSLEGDPLGEGQGRVIP